MKQSWNRGWKHEPRQRPPWWPDEEKWPPRRRRRHSRGAFFWRAAMFFMFMVFIPAAACIGLLWLLGLIGESTAPVNAAAFAVLGMFGMGLFFALLAGLRRMTMPLSDIIDAAGRVEAGDYATRVDPRGPRELRQLGKAFNDMAERLELTEVQRRNLVADLSHELRTPVSVIQGNLEGVLDGVYPPDADHLQPVLDEVRLLSRLIEDLRTLSEAESGILKLNIEPTDLGILMNEVAHSFKLQAEAASISIQVGVPADLPLVSIDPLRIREVLVNLVSNALKHTPGSGSVKVGAVSRDGYVQVSVADTGSGIEPDDLEHVFERFYKTDGSSGSGLGLTIAKNLVSAHGGEISAESTAGKGTTMRFTLPIE